MADISKITLPSGTTYNIKDATAREDIEQINEIISAITGGDAIIFCGVSSTALTDGGTEKPTVNGVQKNPETGNLFFYGTQEFIWGEDSKWHEVGSLESLGSLAYKNNASATYTPAGSISLSTTGTKVAVSPSESPGDITYTPAGSVSAPVISVSAAGATTTIQNPTSVTVTKTVTAAAPGATAPSNSLTYYSVANETLSLYQIGYTTGDSITTSGVTVKTGDAAYSASSPSFTGTGVRLTTNSIEVPTSASFAGTEATITVS